MSYDCHMVGTTTSALSADQGWIVFFFKLLLNQFRIVYALMLHDIKGRFFGTGIGYIIMIMWPLVHIFVVIILFIIRKKDIPYGSSALLYAATGVVPFIAISYISRFMCLGAIQNKSFLAYPVIRPLDIMTARACLELNTNFVVLILMFVILVGAGVNPAPIDFVQAAEAYGASLALGLGIGYFSGTIAMIFPLFNLFTVLFIIASYASSGIFFDVSALPNKLQYWLSFMPVAQAVCWMRSAFYLGYPVDILSKTYLLAWAATTFTLALVLEKLLRKLL